MNGQNPFGLGGSYHTAEAALREQYAQQNVIPITGYYEQPQPQAQVTPQSTQQTPQQQFQANDKDGDGYVSDAENTSGYTVVETVVTPTEVKNPATGIAKTVGDIWAQYKIYIIGIGALVIYWFVLRPMLAKTGKKLQRKFKKLMD